MLNKASESEKPEIQISGFFINPTFTKINFPPSSLYFVIFISHSSFHLSQSDPIRSIHLFIFNYYSTKDQQFLLSVEPKGPSINPHIAKYY